LHGKNDVGLELLDLAVPRGLVQFSRADAVEYHLPSATLNAGNHPLLELIRKRVPKFPEIAYDKYASRVTGICQVFVGLRAGSGARGKKAANHPTGEHNALFAQE
jgi:hypothetical protein